MSFFYLSSLRQVKGNRGDHVGMTSQVNMKLMLGGILSIMKNSKSIKCNSLTSL